MAMSPPPLPRACDTRLSFALAQAPFAPDGGHRLPLGSSWRELSARRQRALLGGPHRLPEGPGVVGAVVSPAVDEERRRPRDAARVGALDVELHALGVDPALD